MVDKTSKNNRTLDMYVRLCEGKVIQKSEEALRFGVDERSIQRDIDDIRAFLYDHSANGGQGGREIVYDRTKKGFVMQGTEGALMTNSEILAVCKILLESRAFTKQEIGSILDKLIAGCVPQKNMKLVTDLISNEKFHYVELHHKSHIQDKLWMLGEEIKNCNLLEITYEKRVPKVEEVTRVVEPVAILFSEYYFYLNAYIVEKDSKGHWVHKYDYPAIFRVDRIEKYRQTGERFRISYGGRFEEGEFRKRIQFMYAGCLTRVQFCYRGTSVDAVLDRLPTAKVIHTEQVGEKTHYTINAEVYGKGVLMWLLSQGEAVEVLAPAELREEMKTTLTRMLEMYE